MSGHVEAWSGWSAVDLHTGLLFGIQVAIIFTLITLPAGKVEELSFSQYA